ncbi:MAG TPA: dihydropteroate synthase [Candidatus Saccharimonadales bacterium]|jgi:dihydropteroate synthase|nr:dihydropteroate synthase [Candidatus Saccharimonadales bacterium]
MIQLVGILNVTPDSFSDGGQFLDPERAVDRARHMFAEGAALVDVGAESTRPHATPLTPTEEWARLEPVLKPLLDEFPGKISLDSYHAETVRRALEVGSIIVNDVTGFHNPAMVDVVAEFKPTVIVSHLPGRDIQAAHAEQPVARIEQVRDDLLATAHVLEDKGLRRDQIILDPGIGFGKTMELNQQLLMFAEHVPDYAVMIGYSRKRFLGEHRMELEPNLAAGRIAIAHGAAYLRVHDVAGHIKLQEEV